MGAVMMNNTAYKDFFLGLCLKNIADGTLSIGADMLRIAAGFQALVEIGSNAPHPSAFEEHLWPQIDLELVTAGYDPIFREHYGAPRTAETAVR